MLEARWAICREPGWRRQSVSARNSEEKLQFQPVTIPEELQGGERLDVGPAWGESLGEILGQIIVEILMGILGNQ